MALVCPCVHVELDSGAPEIAFASDEGALVGDQQATLLALDRGGSDEHPPGDRCIPLGGGRWAVGRGSPFGVTWRLASEADMGRVGHPAWLWSLDRWFDSNATDEGPTPAALSLRHLLKRARPLAGRADLLNHLIAATIAALRQDDGPVAIVVDPESGVVHGPAARWFALSLLTSLPTVWRQRLRISTYESNPDPELWDVVITEHSPDGFHVLEIEHLPSVDDDFVARFLLDALNEKEPEKVEAASFLYEGDGGDPWADGIRHSIATGAIAVRPMTKDMLQDDPESARTSVIARLDAGTILNESLADDIAALTLRTGDTSPWEFVADRPAPQREEAVLAFLRAYQKSTPKESVLVTVAKVRPRGQVLGRWVASLLRWCQDGPTQTRALALLLNVVEDDPMPQDPASRASVWTEYMRVLVLTGRYEEAVMAIHGPAARRIIQAGAAQVVTRSWLEIPHIHRTEAALARLTDLLFRLEHGDQAAEDLYMGLLLQEQEDRAEALVTRWATLTAESKSATGGIFVERLAASPHAASWAQTIALKATADRMSELIAPAAVDATDPVWSLAESTHAKRRRLNRRARLATLVRFLPNGAVALERTSRGLLLEPPDWHFPDKQVSAVAAQLAEAPAAAPLWKWVAITTADPTQYDASVLDGTAVDFCSHPPQDAQEREAATWFAESLGMSPAWPSLEHARWLVRLIMARDGDGTRFNVQLAASIVAGIASREDAATHLGAITTELTRLPHEHPALVVYLRRLLPMAWPQGAPEAFVASVDESRIDPRTRTAFRVALQGIKG